MVHESQPHDRQEAWPRQHECQSSPNAKADANMDASTDASTNAKADANTDARTDASTNAKADTSTNANTLKSIINTLFYSCANWYVKANHMIDEKYSCASTNAQAGDNPNAKADANMDASTNAEADANTH